MKRSSVPLRYGVAVLAVGVAVLIKQLLGLGVTQHSAFLPLTAAVAIAAWFGGLGPGLLATALATTAADYFFLPPVGSFTGPGPQAVPLVLYALQGLLITGLVQALHSARARSETSALEARDHQESLRRSEERFRLLVEGVEDYAILMLDPRGRVATWTEGGERIYGYRAEEIIGKHISAFYTEEDLERGQAGEELRVAAQEGRYEEEGVRICKDGSRFWASVLITALRDEEGNLRGFSEVVRDITERKEAEKKLRENEELYRSVVEQAAENIFLVDVETKRVIQANAALQRSLGYSSEEIRQLTLYDIVAHDQENIERNVHRILERGHYHVGERQYRRKDGSLIDVEVSASAISCQGREVMCVVAHDITERKEAETRFRALVEQIPAITYVQEPIESDNPKAVTYMSPRYETVLGYPREAEILDEEHWLRTLHPEDRERVLSEEVRTDETGEPFIIEYRVMAADGRVVWVRDHAVLMRDKEGQPLYWLGVQFDITDQKRAEEAIRRSLDALLALYETGQVLSSSLEREEIGSRLLEIMARIPGTAAAVISLGDDREPLHEWRTIGPESLLASVRDEPEARSTRRAAFEAEQEGLLEMESPALQGRHLAALFLPLRVRDRVIGVLEVYSRHRLAESGAVETFASLANQAASALENARLYEELAEHRRQLQDLVGKLVAAQEEERRRVAYDVHDGLAQVAAAASQHLQNFAADNPPDSARGQEDLDQALELIRQTVQEARNVVADLRPTVLDDFGLATALRLQVQRLRDEGLRVSYEETLGGGRLPDVVETALFRVAQEALTNVRKHARTDRAHVALERRDQEVRLQVRDWGRGFAPDGVADGADPGEQVGLSSMRERVALLAGHLEIHSKPGDGTLVVAEVPLQEETDTEGDVDHGE